MGNSLHVFQENTNFTCILTLFSWNTETIPSSGRAKLSLLWYDRHRKCKDGGQHDGKLELITWPSPREGLGWGGCFAEESDDLKRKFEVEYGGDEARFYKHCPQGFRWTCCGTNASIKYGCDHHGMGSKPCTCDYCRCVWVFFFLCCDRYHSVKGGKTITQ